MDGNEVQTGVHVCGFDRATHVCVHISPKLSCHWEFYFYHAAIKASRRRRRRWRCSPIAIVQVSMGNERNADLHHENDVEIGKRTPSQPSMNPSGAGEK